MLPIPFPRISAPKLSLVGDERWWRADCSALPHGTGLKTLHGPLNGPSPWGQGQGSSLTRMVSANAPTVPPLRTRPQPVVVQRTQHNESPAWGV